MLRYELADGRAQPSHVPHLPAVGEHAGNIFLGVLRAHAPNHRHPSIRAGDQLIKADLLPAGGDLADRLRPVLAHPRIP